MIKFNKNEMKTIDNVLALDDKYPENTHLFSFVIQDLSIVKRNMSSKGDLSNHYLSTIERLSQEIESSPNKCRLKSDNNKLIKLKDIFKEKLKNYNDNDLWY